MTETKKQRFKRIAVSRTDKLLNMIRLLGNCADTGNYAYTEKDVNKIFSTIETDLNNVKALFLKQTSDNKKFKL
jgi:hypothetical protein